MSAADERPSGVGQGAPAGSSADVDELSLQFKKLSAAMEARVRLLQQQEEQLKQAEASLAAASRRMASLAPRLQSDIISLNVGGTHLATSRRTLTLLPDSLLATMFSGSWDDHLQRDESGRVFLDYDPAIFSLILNWLRAQDMGGPDLPLWELSVEQARENQLITHIDFLQLGRYVPFRFKETFSPSLSSPHLSLSDSSAWRPGPGHLGDYLVATSSHSYFDVDVELLIEVLHFGAVNRPHTPGSGPGAARGGGRGGGASRQDDNHDSDDEANLPNRPMFIGVIARGQLAAMDLTKKRVNASWQSTSHGWWTRSNRCCAVEQGKSSLLSGQAFWCEGDTLALSLEAAKHPARAASRPHAGPRLSLTNTRTNERREMDISPSCLGEHPEQWVVIVGLSGRGDEVRINSARRKALKVHAAAAVGDAAGWREGGAEAAAASGSRGAGGPANGTAAASVGNGNGDVAGPG